MLMGVRLDTIRSLQFPAGFLNCWNAVILAPSNHCYKLGRKVVPKGMELYLGLVITVHSLFWPNDRALPEWSICKAANVWKEKESKACK